MKKLILLSVVIIGIISLQSCAMTSKTVLYPQKKAEIIDISNTSKLDLYLRANNWMVNTFVDAESVIQFSDKEGGLVTGKYLLSTIILGTQVTPKRVYAIIKIQVKDNAAKIEITPDSYINNYNSLAGGTSYPVTRANSDINSLFESFKSFMIIDSEGF